MLFSFGHSLTVILPHKDGSVLLQAMVNAECLKGEYSSESTRIIELDRGDFTAKNMSWQEYERIQIAALLNISPEEVKEFAERAERQPS